MFSLFLNTITDLNSGIKKIIFSHDNIKHMNKYLEMAELHPANFAILLETMEELDQEAIKTIFNIKNSYNSTILQLLHHPRSLNKTNDLKKLIDSLNQLSNDKKELIWGCIKTQLPTHCVKELWHYMKNSTTPRFKLIEFDPTSIKNSTDILEQLRTKNDVEELFTTIKMLNLDIKLLTSAEALSVIVKNDEVAKPFFENLQLQSPEIIDIALTNLSKLTSSTILGHRKPIIVTPSIKSILRILKIKSTFKKPMPLESVKISLEDFLKPGANIQDLKKIVKILATTGNIHYLNLNDTAFQELQTILSNATIDDLSELLTSNDFLNLLNDIQIAKLLFIQKNDQPLWEQLPKNDTTGFPYNLLMYASRNIQSKELLRIIDEIHSFTPEIKKRILTFNLKFAQNILINIGVYRPSVFPSLLRAIDNLDVNTKKLIFTEQTHEGFNVLMAVTLYQPRELPCLLEAINKLDTDTKKIIFTLKSYNPQKFEHQNILTLAARYKPSALSTLIESISNLDIDTQKIIYNQKFRCEKKTPQLIAEMRPKEFLFILKAIQNLDIHTQKTILFEPNKFSGNVFEIMAYYHPTECPALLKAINEFDPEIVNSIFTAKEFGDEKTFIQLLFKDNVLKNRAYLQPLLKSINQFTHDKKEFFWKCIKTQLFDTDIITLWHYMKQSTDPQFKLIEFDPISITRSADILEQIKTKEDMEQLLQTMHARKMDFSLLLSASRLMKLLKNSDVAELFFDTLQTQYPELQKIALKNLLEIKHQLPSSIQSKIILLNSFLSRDQSVVKHNVKRTLEDFLHTDCDIKDLIQLIDTFQSPIDSKINPTIGLENTAFQRLKELTSKGSFREIADLLKSELLFSTLSLKQQYEILTLQKNDTSLWKECIQSMPAIFPLILKRMINFNELSTNEILYNLNSEINPNDFDLFQHLITDLNLYIQEHPLLLKKLPLFELHKNEREWLELVITPSSSTVLIHDLLTSPNELTPEENHLLLKLLIETKPENWKQYLPQIRTLAQKQIQFYIVFIRNFDPNYFEEKDLQNNNLLLEMAINAPQYLTEEFFKQIPADLFLRLITEQNTQGVSALDQIATYNKEVSITVDNAHLKKMASFLDQQMKALEKDNLDTYHTLIKKYAASDLSNLFYEDQFRIKPNLNNLQIAVIQKLLTLDKQALLQMKDPNSSLQIILNERFLNHTAIINLIVDNALKLPKSILETLFSHESLRKVLNRFSAIKPKIAFWVLFNKYQKTQLNPQDLKNATLSLKSSMAEYLLLKEESQALTIAQLANLLVEDPKTYQDIILNLPEMQRHLFLKMSPFDFLTKDNMQILTPLLKAKLSTQSSEEWLSFITSFKEPLLSFLQTLTLNSSSPRHIATLRQKIPTFFSHDPLPEKLPIEQLDTKSRQKLLETKLRQIMKNGDKESLACHLDLINQEISKGTLLAASMYEPLLQFLVQMNMDIKYINIFLIS